MTNSKSWYSIRAAGKKRASIDIDGEIGAWGVTSQQFKKDIAALGDVQNIKVTVNSIGGSVGDGVSIKNTLKDHPAKVNIHVDGYALSIASVIITGGDQVTAADDSMLMIHDPWTMAVGTADDMDKAAKRLRIHKEAIVQSYLARDLEYTEDELREAMAEETWYTAEQAREIGLIDKVKKSDDKNDASMAYASADLYRYKNAPKNFIERFAVANSSKIDDGSAVETTEGIESMTTEVTVSEAEHTAAIQAAIEANDNKWKALLEHEKAANTEAVIEIAAMNLSAEKSASLMNLVACPCQEPTQKVETESDDEDKEKEKSEADKEAEAKAARSERLEAAFVEFMNKSELNEINKNAANDGNETEKQKEPDSSELLKSLRTTGIA